MANQKELQKAFLSFLVQDAAQQGIKIQSEQDLQAYAQQLGEDGVKAKYQEFMQRMQGGIKARLGAKLNYYSKLKGQCAEDEELVYFKKGGQICKACQKKQKACGGKKLNAVQAFKAQKGQKVNPNDTIHTKNGVRNLSNKPLPYKKLSKGEYQRMNSYEKSRVDMKDLDSGRSDENPTAPIKKKK